MMVPDADQRELLGDFVDESLQALRALPELLAEYRRCPEKTDPIHAVFRAVHSMKGCAGFLGLVALKKFAHAVENTLDQIRKKQIALTDELSGYLVEALDLLDELLQSAQQGVVETALSPRHEQLLQRIAAARVPAVPVGDSPESALLRDVLQLVEELERDASLRGWAQRGRELVARYQAARGLPASGPSVSFAAESSATGTSDDTPATNSPSPAVRTAASFESSRFAAGGQDATAIILEVVKSFRAIELAANKDPNLGQAFLRTATDCAAWAEAANQHELASALHKAAADFRTIDNSPVDLDATLLRLVWEPLVGPLAMLEQQPDTPDPGSRRPSAAPADGDGAAAAKDSTAPPGGKTRFVRVKEEHLDEFVGCVSRLFITCELYKELHSRMVGAEDVSSLVDELRRINVTFSEQSTALQQSVVALRRVAISTFLSKFPKMARDLANQLGKKIEVHLSGQETQVDKSLLEDLDAPLTHMIRNVVDHGIETPDERLARGAPAAGNLWLRAEQTRTHVRLTVQDDGRGIDPQRIRAKAVRQGLLSESQAAALSDSEAIQLIFEAGFSTAEKVSEVSGRGVGMDVVRTMVRNYKGEIHVSSQVGEGTTFRLDIPLRTAVVVVDGLMLRHAGQDFVVPFEHIIEITRIDPASLRYVQGQPVAIIRGQTYAALPLERVLGLESAPAAGPPIGVLVGNRKSAVCLLVDEVRGHRQAVITGIADLVHGIDKAAGVAQLGGGKLALVLSVPDVLRSVAGGKGS
jgi:two-component system chemotaxis sensor kinase CheA